MYNFTVKSATNLNLRNAFHKNMQLTFFQPQQPTFLYVDAHINGLSVTLLQGTTTIATAKQIAFYSRATMIAVSCCSQLDLEALAIDLGLLHFHEYLIGGLPATIITDHKSIVVIFSNNCQGLIRTDHIKLCHQDTSYEVV